MCRMITAWLRVSSLVLAVPLLVACGSTSTSDTVAKESTSTELADGDSKCTDPQRLPENDLTAEQPFGVVNDQCKVVPYVNPADAVDCATVWQVGERLPDDYSGCNTPSWPWCDDPGLGAYKYQDMYADPGGVIVKGKRQGPDDSPC